MHLLKKTPDLYQKHPYSIQHKDVNCLNWMNYQAVDMSFLPRSECYIAKPYHPDQKPNIYKGLPIGDPAAKDIYDITLFLIQNSKNKNKL